MRLDFKKQKSRIFTIICIGKHARGECRKNVSITLQLYPSIIIIIILLKIRQSALRVKMTLTTTGHLAAAFCLSNGQNSKLRYTENVHCGV